MILDLEFQMDKSNKELAALAKENEKLTSDLDQYKCELNLMEQYSRRNCIRIFGIPESTGENTDQIITKLAEEKLGVDLKLSDIDRSHRIGKPNGKGSRSIIMKFTNYNIKSRVLRARRKLKSSGIGIQEDLTARNKALLQKVKDHLRVSSAWTIDGRIFALTKSADGVELKKRINGLNDLNNL